MKLNELTRVEHIAAELNRKHKAGDATRDPVSARTLKEAIDKYRGGDSDGLAGRKVGDIYLTTETAVVEWVLRQPRTKEGRNVPE